MIGGWHCSCTDDSVNKWWETVARPSFKTPVSETSIFPRKGIPLQGPSRKPLFQKRSYFHVKAQIHSLTQSCDRSVAMGKQCNGPVKSFQTDFISPLHWFPAATHLFARLSPKVDRVLEGVPYQEPALFYDKFCWTFRMERVRKWIGSSKEFLTKNQTSFKTTFAGLLGWKESDSGSGP